MTNPGWFDDPNNDAQIRYFDGQNWTERTRPKPTEPEPVASKQTSDDATPKHTATEYNKPDWIPLAITGAVIATLAVVGLLLVTQGGNETAATGDSSQAASPTATTPTRQDSPLPTLTETVEPETTTSTFAEGPTPDNEWILIWESREKTVYSRADVEQEANDFRTDGIHVEILDSDEYGASDSAGPLNRGYWVIWSGPLPTRENVVEICEEWQTIYPRCYPRLVYPK